MGLDPDKWFQNVEYAALRIVGQETVNFSDGAGASGAPPTAERCRLAPRNVVS
jgi:hypothetical protein